MREILFRGKRKDNGEWVEGYFVNCIDEFYRGSGPIPEIIMVDADRICAGEDTYDKTEEVIPETVGQYIGLKDRNGRRIFEGDILESIVKRVGQKLGNLIVINDIRECKFVALYVDQYRVIGNIHDNPELLEGVK